MKDMLSSSNELFEEAPKRKRGFVFWGMALLAILLIGILIAPTVLTRTSARDYLLAKFIPADAALVSMKSVKAGWFTPLQVDGLRILDAEGKPLVEADRIQGERSLLELARDYTNIGELTVDSPTVHLQLRPDGSNLEDTLAKLTANFASDETTSDSSSSTESVSARVKVLNAKVLATEQATNTTWTLEQFNAEAVLPKAAEEAWVVGASGMIDGQPFSLEANTALGLATDVWPLGPEGDLKIKTQALPLAPVRYAALRAGQPIEQIQGNLSVDAVSHWQSTATSRIPQLNATAKVQVDNLQLASQELLGQDTLALRQTNFNGDVSLANDVLHIKDCVLKTDFGTTSIKTAGRLSQLADPNAIVEAIRKQELTTSGTLDVAALTRTLPNTLKIRDDVQVASGRVTWNVQSEPGNVNEGIASASNTRWSGHLQTEDVQVLRAGQPIQWDFPLTVDFAVIDGTEVEVENVLAKSDFFSLNGFGKLRSGNLRANANLEKLVYQLGQVIDINEMYVAGTMQSIVEWKEAEANQLGLKAQTKLTDFVMAQNEQLLCQEKELVTVVDAKATLDGQNIASLNSGRVDLVSANDFFVAELQSAISNPSAQSDWPVLCRLKGNLATWFARLKPFGVGIGWDLAGEVDTTTLVTGNQRGVAIQSLVADIRNLEAISDGIHVKEPVVQLKSAGTVDLSTFACRFPNTTLGSQSVALSANQVSVDMEPNFIVSGDVGYRANIARLLSYVEQDPATTTTQVSGEASGRLQLQAQQDTTNFQLTSEIVNLRVDEVGESSLQANPTTPAGPIWQEPKLLVETTGSYHAAQDSLDLTTAQVIGKVLNLSAKGSAAQLTTQPAVDVVGEYGYDLDGIMAIFGDLIGKDILLTGNQTQRFAVRGPLFPANANAKDRVSYELVAQAGVGWQSATVYETPLGPGQVDAQLTQGVLQMTPLQLAVGEGQVRVAPTLHVNTAPLWMTIAPATVIDQVQITPQMTKTWMKYVAPLLADATNAEGKFSVGLSKAEVPLMDPMAGTVEGQFVVHGGALGPGPLATQFIELASQIKSLVGKGSSRITDPTKTWVQLAPQQVDFQVAENRVYHEGFEMVIDGVPIRTRGSVGMLDESVNVLAEVPIMDEWIQGTAALEGLRGQVIAIPVSGTTSNPRLDQQALQQVSTQLARSAASGFIKNEVGKQLQKQLGVDNVQEAIGGAQEKLNTKLQSEIGKQLNKLFK